VARWIIAIDGPAAAGKGTLARRLAGHLQLPYLDTGLLYRAVGRRVLDRGESPSDAEASGRAACDLRADDLERTDLRGPEADTAAAAVASVPGVRAALLAFQRDFGAAQGAVLDGRDIGTVVFPNADLKLFITASPEARAHRRWLELHDRGVDVDPAEVERDIRARDRQDAARAIAPLRPADDAVVIDTTALDRDAAFAAVLGVAGERLGLSVRTCTFGPGQLT
jgi:cytidylate kinase